MSLRRPCVSRPGRTRTGPDRRTLDVALQPASPCKSSGSRLAGVSPHGRGGVKRYNRTYFDRWYRDAQRRVRTDAELRRRVGLVVSVAEYVLGRPVRTVLDVGCGEGAWQPHLRRLRPAVRYQGIDPSGYAVRRYGVRRNLAQGTLAALDCHVGAERVDLILCADVLHYLPARELGRGLAQLHERLRGVAYLPVFTSADLVEGDQAGWYHRAPSYYRKLFARAGLAACGLHCYLTTEVAGELAALEHPVGRVDGGWVG